MTRRKVLITGASGLIGGLTIEHLHEKYDFSGLSRRVVQGIPHVAADITDAAAIKPAFAGVHTVLHLAAANGPDQWLAWEPTMAITVQGTLNVLEACRRGGVERVVHTSTSECYGTALYTPIDEKHPLQGQSPYSASKIAADKMAEAYHCSFGLPVSTLRPFNTFGPRQSSRAIIPTIAGQLLWGVPELRLGSLDPVRDLVYVRDTATGFIALADAPECVGRVTNLATGVGVSIGELAERICRIVGRSVPIVQTDERRRPEASEVFRLLGSARQAHELAGWKAQTPLDDGLQRTVEWVRANLKSYRVGEYRI